MKNFHYVMYPFKIASLPQEVQDVIDEEYKLIYKYISIQIIDNVDDLGNETNISKDIRKCTETYFGSYYLGKLFVPGRFGALKLNHNLSERQINILLAIHHSTKFKVSRGLEQINASNEEVCELMNLGYVGNAASGYHLEDPGKQVLLYVEVTPYF